MALVLMGILMDSMDNLAGPSVASPLLRLSMWILLLFYLKKRYMSLIMNAPQQKTASNLFNPTVPATSLFFDAFYDRWIPCYTGAVSSTVNTHFSCRSLVWSHS
uniref:Uncharacterized protein n=1 Tax=Opuntia streptacantha TaxID=393608 RepID=A0A7C9AEX2_OPUST